MIKAVCDTSVLVPPSSRRRLVQAAREGLFVPYWSPWIIGELYRVLMWQWFEDKRGDYALCAKLSNTMMEQMSAYFLVADPKPPFDQGWPNFQDINDTPIWSLAKMIGANFVVSNNTRHFPPEDNGKCIYEGIEYVTARQFLDIIGFEIQET